MKPYIKPELFYERYEVSQHLAAGCAWEFQGHDKPENCIATPDRDLPFHPSLFLDEGLGCQYTEVNEYEHYCYQNSDDGIKLFMS